METGALAGLLLVAAATAAALLLVGLHDRQADGDDLSRAWPTRSPTDPPAAPAVPVTATTASPEKAPGRAAMLLGLGTERALGRGRTVAAMGAILLLAAALRLPLLDRVPAGIFCDEAADGYNAYSLLHTGRDEHGTLLPIFIPSFGTGLKNPAYVYAAIVPVALFGPDDLTVRLPAAGYGILAVLAIFFLGRTLYNDKVGVLAALLLALSPWHLHFSRIAFDLIALPTFFLIGLTCLMRGIEQGERRLFVAAGVLLGLGPYSYSIANVFVPLMLAAIVALFWRELWAQRRNVWPGVLALGLTLGPLLYFKLFDPRDVDRFSLIGIVDPGASWSQITREFLDNYREYLSFRFLFQEGDPILRHSVTGFGENLLSLSPWCVIGLIAAFSRARRGLLLAWWLLTWPVAAALVRETPSATRSIVGAPLFPLLAAVGLVAGWSLLAMLRGKPRALLRVILAVAATLSIGVEATRYLRSYFVEYPKYSAPTYYGFQYGYRDSIRFMEERRGEFDRLVLTATEVNQPEIFALFYSQRDPAEYHATGNVGYDVFVPEHYSQYDLDAGRMLFQAHPSDTFFFEEFDLLHEVTAPAGEVVYNIIEPRRRKRFLDQWEAIGPLAPELSEIPADGSIEASDPGKQWQTLGGEFVYRDLDVAFGASDHLCAVAATDVVLEGPATDAWLECIGSEDVFAPSIAGQSFAPVTLERRVPKRFAVRLETGPNRLRALSCDSEGDWMFACSVADADGRSLDQVESRAPGMAPAGEPAEPEVRRVLSGGIELTPVTELGEGPRRIDLAGVQRSGGVEVSTNDPSLAEQLGVLFDGNTESLLRSEQINPFFVTFTFRAPVVLAGARVFPSYSSYDWALQTGPDQEWQVVRGAPGEAWSGIELEQSVETTVVKIELLRRELDDFVHLNEVEIWIDPSAAITPPQLAP